jgi:hypothetical protein
LLESDVEDEEVDKQAPVMTHLECDVYIARVRELVVHEGNQEAVSLLEKFDKARQKGRHSKATYKTSMKNFLKRKAQD